MTPIYNQLNAKFELGSLCFKLQWQTKVFGNSIS